MHKSKGHILLSFGTNPLVSSRHIWKPAENKATLIHCLEKGVTPAINRAAVFDAKAIIQHHMPTGTFEDLAKDILRDIIKVA